MPSIRVVAYYLSLILAVAWLWQTNGEGWTPFEKVAVLLLLAIAVKEDRHD